ncbi:MAG: hypothetical protein IJX14_08085 [Clostridia bacterium]|nr:hypothetical protein [Clostridia bacterium]
MTYRPNPNPSVPTMLSFLSLGIGIVGYIAGVMTERFAWVFQLVCLAGVVASLYLLLRWRMTWFVFAIRPRDSRDAVWEDAEPALAGGISLRYAPADLLDFIVVKGQGSRGGVMECVLGLDSLVQASVVCRTGGGDVPVYSRKDILGQYPGAKVYEYIQTYRWEKAVLAVFRDGEGYAALLLDLPEETEIGRILLSKR